MKNLILILVLSAVGCTAGESIQLTEQAEPESIAIQWPSEVDGSTGLGVDTTGGGATTAPDEFDCDGGMCTPNTPCSGTECANNADGMATDVPCNHNTDCPVPGTVCPGPNSLCVDYSVRPSCGSTVCGDRQVCRDCPFSPTECADELMCLSTDRVCQNLSGADCNTSCACADSLICDMSNQRCVQCLTTEAHCTNQSLTGADQLETCNSAGLCSPVVELTFADLAVTRRLIVQEILFQVRDLVGSQARALITFEQKAQFTSEGQPVSEISPEIVFTENRCAVVTENLDLMDESFTAEDKARVLAVFGCTANGSQTNRFIWDQSLATPGLGQIGCLVYQPRMPSNDGSCHRWRVWLGPCENVWSARLDASVCTNSEPAP